MSELIKAQIFIMAVMTVCGLATGLVYDTFQIIIKKKIRNIAGEIFMQLVCFLSIGFLIGKFFLYADNGKLTLLGFITFGIGLLLWKKKICVIICDEGEGEANDETKRKTSRVRKRQQSNKYRRNSEHKARETSNPKR